MRSIVLVTLSALVLAVLFIGYWTMQPFQRAGADSNPATPFVPTSRPAGPAFGPGVHRGDVIWLKQFDDSGRLASEFHGDSYTPQRDGTVLVAHPHSRFYLANHQHIEITGQTGNVVVKDMPGAANGLPSAAPTASPTRGRLQDVLVQIFDDEKNVPVFTMRTNNVVFDNETYRVSTEGYRDLQGNQIAADEVPVHATGQQAIAGAGSATQQTFKMEGRGLTIQWDEKDGRLELLEVAHGEYLEIEHPSSFSPAGSSKGEAGRSARGPEGPLPQMLAAADRSAAGQILTHHPPPQTRPHHDAGPQAVAAPVIYLASFFDDVRITQAQPSGQGEQLLIQNVRQMDVDFLMKPASSASTQPASPQPPASQSSPAAQSLARPLRNNAGAAPATRPVSAPEPPIVVRWSGVLRITPLRSAPPAPLKPGDSTITLLGGPVSIHRVDPRQQDVQDIRCTSVLYETSGDKVLLEKSTAFPNVLIDQIPGSAAKDQGPSHIVSQGSVLYARADQQVLLSGSGSAQLPVQAAAGTRPGTMQATWSKQARLDLTQPQNQKQQTIREAQFAGNVEIEHPRLSLKSQSLDLLFDAIPPSPSSEAQPAAAGQQTSQVTLRQAIATTDVFCKLLGDDSKPQSIQCRRLALDTALADGRLYTRHVNATGAVHARGEDDLRAEYLDLLLTPSPRRAKEAAADQAERSDQDQTAQVQLEKMVARDQVVATSKDKSVASGDELRVDVIDGKQHTVLTSRSQAKVTDAKGNIVSGPAITFNSADGKAKVVGPGSLHAIQQASTTQPAQPVDVTWLGGAQFDGPANRIDVDQNVMARSIDQKGFVDNATGEHIRIDLIPKPKAPDTQPSAKESATAAASRGAGAANMDLFKDKQMSTLTIEKNARLLSTQSGADGSILQQFELKGPTIVIRQLAPDGTPARSVSVRDAGAMLVRDLRPAESAKNSRQDDNSSGSARGSTAFEWHKSLVYSEADRRADLIGQVLVVHSDQDTRQPPVRLNADHVIAFFQPASQKPAGKAGDQSSMELKFLTAKGGTVVVTRDTSQMTAQQVDYDPKRHVLIATGTQRDPVIFNTGGTGQTIAQRVEWDTITWDPKFKNAIIDSNPVSPDAPPPRRPLPKHKQ